MGETLPDTLAGEIRAHALTDPTHEVCGLVVALGAHARAIPCKNVCEQPTEYFRFDGKEYRELSAAHKVLAIYHSHPRTGPAPTDADKTDCERQKLPYCIYSVSADRFAWHEPHGFRAPLVGRPFLHGLLDCYTLVRDWYALQLGVYLPDFEREDRWWQKGQNLYTENFAACGFYEIALRDVRRGDALLFALESLVPNHSAVYLGDGQMIHHPPDHRSCEQSWVAHRGFYFDRFRLALRKS